MRKTVFIVFLVSAIACLFAQDRRVRPSLRELPQVCECVAPDCNGQHWDPDLCEWVGDCGVVVTSGWHKALSKQWLTIPLDGAEIFDSDDLHDPGSEFIRIQTRGFYEVRATGVVGLYGPNYPTAWGSQRDRRLSVWRSRGTSGKYIGGVQATADRGSQAYIEPYFWVELRAGDRLSFRFLYNTDEPYLWISLYRVSVRLIDER